MMTLAESVKKVPLIAVLRGINPTEAKQVGRTLVEAGFTCMEVPVRSKKDGFKSLDADALASLGILMKECSADANVGAGTVLETGDIAALQKIGIRDCLAPNFNAAVVTEAKRLGTDFIPGIETVSEAKAALAAGASALKLFPCVMREADGSITYRHAPAYVKTLVSFCPAPIYPSGGIDWTIAPLYRAAGAAGINIGGELYSPGRSLEDLADRARKFVAAVKG
ncbi:MAG: 2-dehydro-3-deoxy-6-phosphogalactonate aldolase [Alphaproteobacteria bacterium]|nr:2-dehydro-3-deoxy-6-phosphogalactonate aldolase [Alphaproteobacteria bacterium]MBV8549002.1 2-dehydro-3-deoxy-6-phosphogalactonate aldolase [Alphaproteobacteria bacterium]